MQQTFSASKRFFFFSFFLCRLPVRRGWRKVEYDRIRREYLMLTAFFKGKFNSVVSPRSGVIGWVTQGLTKVLPQPEEKYKEIEDPNEEHTEVRRKDLIVSSLSASKRNLKLILHINNLLYLNIEDQNQYNPMHDLP